MRDCPLVSMATGSRRWAWGTRVRVLDNIVAAARRLGLLSVLAADLSLLQRSSHG